MNNNTVVIADGLTKKYGELVALDNLSIHVDRGQILGFIGPNGAGKTTTIKILVGQVRPTSGSGSIAGADCVHDSQRVKRLVGYMPDTFGTYDNMRVHEYLDFFGAAFQIPRQDRIRRVAEVLDTAGATYMKDRFVESLSHGMKQRVAIARTLLHDPEVLILDEPANGLDPHARIEMRQLLLQLADMGKTLIVTSHILPELSRICDQVAIVTHGKLQAFGALDDILRQFSQRRAIEIQLLDSSSSEQATSIVQAAVEESANVIASKTEATIRFETNQSEQQLGQLLSQLVAGGIGISQFREEPVDLEDTFLSITQQTNKGQSIE